MVALSTVLDATQQPHWCVPTQILIKLHCVEVFYSDPSENGPATGSMWHNCMEVTGFNEHILKFEVVANLAFSISDPQRPTSCRTKSVNVF